MSTPTLALLRARRERPTGRHCAAEQRDEIAPYHFPSCWVSHNFNL
jgi:hypothetical protein